MAPVLAPALAGVLALAAYLVTLSPSISWADGASDSGELAAAAYVLGVPHPTTYPLYMILGWAVSHLPLGEPAYDLNLFSALCGALTVSLVVAVAAVLPGRPIALIGQRVGAGTDDGSHRLRCLPLFGLVIGGCFLAAVPAFWVQATSTETRTLAAALVAIVLMILVCHCKTRSRRLLLAGWVIEGVALTDHLLCLAALPALAAVTLTYPLPCNGNVQKRVLARVRLVLTAAAMLLPGLMLYVYVPLRAAAGPWLNWGDARTLRRFVWMVTGAQYRPLMQLNPGDLPGQFSDRAQALAGGLGPIALLAGCVGLALLWRRRPHPALVLLLTLVTALAQSSLYGAAAAPDYLIPAEMVLAVGAAYLLSALLEACARRPDGWAKRRGVHLPWPIGGVAVVMTAMIGLSQQVSWQRATSAQQDSRMARDYALVSLLGLPRHALILAGGDEQTFALWYAQFALGIRPDLAVVNTDLLAWQWYATAVRRHYPQLRWNGVPWPNADQDLDVYPARSAARATAREAALIRANVNRVPIFWTAPDGVDDGYCGIEVQGNLFRCYPLGQA